jgi:hypothetical protein
MALTVLDIDPVHVVRVVRWAGRSAHRRQARASGAEGTAELEDDRMTRPRAARESDRLRRTG